MVTYSIYLDDPFGNRLADASNFISLSYSRTSNDWSTLKLVLPGTYNTNYIIIPDGRIEVWRNIDGREYLDTETIWLIKTLMPTLDDSGRITYVIEADTPLCILKEPGRFVNFVSGSSQATKAAAPADDQIKAFVKDAIGSTAGAARSLTNYISIAANTSQAPNVAKTAAWRDVLKVCQEIAQAAAQDSSTPTYVAFDIVAPQPDGLEFRTYVQQRGADHRFPGGINPVILSPNFGNLGACTLKIDYREEVTYAEAGGQGEGSNRLLATAQDNARIGASPFGYRELFVEATQYNSSTGLAAEAQAAVWAGRPRITFQGRVLETPDTRYGVEWQWGDFVTATFQGHTFDCRIEAITVTVENGKENIDAWVRNSQ